MLRLFISNEEYSFDGTVNFTLHPTNFSKMIFNNVIKKSDNVYPKMLGNILINREFSIAKVYDDNNLIFFGVINATGRLSILPNNIKTRSIEICDMRKWLSLLKPVNRIFFKTTPAKIVNELITGLGEKWLSVGNLSFTDSSLIEAYSLIDKSPYQILKDVIAPFTDSMLYFTIDNEGDEPRILVNYKSADDFNNNVSEIKLDTSDKAFFDKYKIIDVLYENSTEQYANIVRYVSDNTISNVPNVETIPVNKDTILTKKNIAKVDLGLTKMYDMDGTEINIVILEAKATTADKFAHFIYTQGSTQLIVHTTIIDKKYTLHIQYYTKEKLSIELSNQNEIDEIAYLSGTSGRIFIIEKMNDISSSKDLVRKAQNKLSLSATPHNVLEVTAERKIWSLMDIVNVVSVVSNVNGNYMVSEISGTTQVAGDSSIEHYTYKLIKSKNTDTWINAFDSQSYRDNSVVEGTILTAPTEVINININLNIITTNLTGIVSAEPGTAKYIEDGIESELTTNNITYIYKQLVVQNE